MDSAALLKELGIHRTADFEAAEEAYDRGIGHLSEKDHLAAAEAFAEAARHEPCWRYFDCAGEAAKDIEHYDAALGYFEAAAAEQRRLVESRGGPKEYSGGHKEDDGAGWLAAALEDQVECLFRLGRPADVAPLAREAKTLRQIANGLRDRDGLEYDRNDAFSLFQRGETALAERMLRDILSTAQRLEMSRAKFPWLREVRLDLAIIAANRGAMDETDRLMARCLAEARVDLDLDREACVHWEYAMVLHKSGRLDEARHHFEACSAFERLEDEPTTYHDARLLTWRSKLRWRDGDALGARDDARRAAVTLRRMLGEDAPYTQEAQAQWTAVRAGDEHA